jgi:hypothetical protein
MATLDARLAEIDSKLRGMQAELAPERELGEPAGPPPTADAQPRTDPSPELARRLLASVRELLAGYEAVLATPERRSGTVALSAGPFTGTAALRQFERDLVGIPGVREVTLRGFEGADRAIVEVQLDE